MSTVTFSAMQSGHPPKIPKDFNSRQSETIRLYPLSNYTFGVKETQPEEDPSVLARLKRLYDATSRIIPFQFLGKLGYNTDNIAFYREEHYEKYGMRRTSEGILVCHVRVVIPILTEPHPTCVQYENFQS